MPEQTQLSDRERARVVLVLIAEDQEGNYLPTERIAAAEALLKWATAEEAS